MQGHQLGGCCGHWGQQKCVLAWDVGGASWGGAGWWRLWELSDVGKHTLREGGGRRLGGFLAYRSMILAGV